MRDLILVEEPPLELEVGEDDVVVALTAVACYALREAGVRYELLGDAHEVGLQQLAADRWEAQLAWLASLDEALGALLPQLARSGLEPALLQGHNLKVAMDVVYVRTYEALLLLDRQPRRVVLYQRAHEDDVIGPNLGFVSGPSVLSRVLPGLAIERGVQCEARTVRPYLLGDPGRSGETPTAFEESVRRVWRVFGYATDYLVGACRRITRRDSGLTLLFLNRFYDLGTLLRAAHRNGHRCLLLTRRGVADVSTLRGHPLAADLSFLWGRVLAPARVSEPVDEGDFASAAASIVAPTHPLWAALDGLYGVPVSEPVRPRIAYWVESVIPQLLHDYVQARVVLERERVDYLLAANLYSIEDYAFAAAARSSARTQAVQIEHGDSPLGAAVWDLLNLFQYDRHFAPSTDLADHYRVRARLYQRRTAELSVGSYRWQRALAQRPAHRSARATRPRVVFPVGDLNGDGRYLNTDLYPDAWLFELQRTLIETFADDRRYTFVVKPFPRQSAGEQGIRNPIDRVVAELGCEHVQLSMTSFPELLMAADRVVLDSTSTPIYETALAGVPFLAVLHERVNVRPAAAEQLEKHIAKFRTFEEAVDLVRRFLDDPSPPRPIVAWDAPPILATLEQLAENPQLS